MSLKKYSEWKKFHQLLNEWKYEKNNPVTPKDISPASHKKIWWRCSNNLNHEWQAAYKDRVFKNSGCPFCAGRKSDVVNCLKSTHPDISKEWNYKKNILKPTDITAGSNKKVWWICSKNNEHEWQSSCANRSQKLSSCPYCEGKKASTYTNLAVKFPQIAAEWHPIKNGILTAAHVLPGSAKKIWWQCSKDINHEWMSTINNRTSKNKTDCPLCMNNFKRNKILRTGNL